MTRSRSIRFGLTVLVALQSGASALAESDSGPDQGSAAPAGTRVPLGCRIIDGSLVAITNTTGVTIPDGAEISYDGLSTAYGDHYGATFASGPLAPGEIVRKKAPASASCTAWFTQPAAVTPPAPEPAAPAAGAPPAAEGESAPAAAPAQ